MQRIRNISQKTAAIAGTQARRPPSVEVALATCNSARYLRELLDSLFGQSFRDFTLLVSDDGSTDATHIILAGYAHRYPARMRIIRSNEPARGPLANFARLADHLTADYALFCDHDDVWLPNKIAVSIAKIRLLEKERGRETPLLVHTDLVVVGADLKVLGPSLMHYQNMDPLRDDLVSLLARNVVSGCSCIVNRPLYERARPVPPVALMHDHWLALVASAVGGIGYIDRATILYRQHGDNCIGATPIRAAYVRRRVEDLLIQGKRRRTLRRLSLQASELLSRLGQEMSLDHRRATFILAHLWSFGRWQRFRLMRRHRLLPEGFIAKIALFLALIRTRRQSI